MSIEILTPGVFSSVQDLGRFGHYNKGLTQSGPLDLKFFECINRLLENPSNASQIEIFYGGISFVAHANIVICVGAVEGNLLVDQKPYPLWQTLCVAAGQLVEVGYFATGRIGYLGVAGGFDLDEVFGSTSTVVREKIGGLGAGNILKQGEVLACQPSRRSSERYLPMTFLNDGKEHNEIRVVVGYQYNDFTPVQQQRFFSNDYVVTDRFDRMGCQLQGPNIKPSKTDYYSEGIARGAIQITNQGQPIVLLNDRQTIGGYPKLGSVFSLDLRHLVQTKTGDTVRFSPISIEQAHNLLHLNASADRRILPRTV